MPSLRLMYSSKFGKQTTFNPVNVNSDNNQSSQFFDSLITDKSLVVNTFDVQENELPLMNNKKKTGVISLISSFPKFDHFVQSLIGIGQISNAVIFDNKGTTNMPMIMYNIKNYNYCENVVRSHKSNNIYYIADISKNCVFQKCHKCIGFRGKDLFLKDV